MAGSQRSTPTAGGVGSGGVDAVIQHGGGVGGVVDAALGQRVDQQLAGVCAAQAPGRRGCGAAPARLRACSALGSPHRRWRRVGPGPRRRGGSRPRRPARRSTCRLRPPVARRGRRLGGLRWWPRLGRRRGPACGSGRRRRCRGGWPWATAAGAGRPRRSTGRGGFRRWPRVIAT